MKIQFYSMIFIIFYSSTIFADEIYLKDSSIIKCGIIQVTDNNIEYREIEGKPFLTVSKSLVEKIAYQDGRVVQIAENKQYDKIYLKDGRIIEGRVLKVTPEVVIYNVIDSDKKEALVRDNVIKIVLADEENNKILEKESESETVSEEKETSDKKEEYFIQSGGFIDSFIQIGFSGGVGVMWGELDTKEESAYDRYKNQIITYPVYPSDYDNSLDHYSFHGGFDITVMLPSSKYSRRSFGLTGIKYGIIGSYIYTNAEQELRDLAISDNIYTGTLLRYRTVNVGPDMNFILSSKNSIISIVPHVYLLAGYIHKGTIKALPGLRDAGLSLNTSDYKTSFTGYSAAVGTGIRFVFNRGFPFCFGFNIQYTYSQIELERSLPVYNTNDKKISFNDIGFNISLGVHI